MFKLPIYYTPKIITWKVVNLGSTTDYLRKKTIYLLSYCATGKMKSYVGNFCNMPCCVLLKAHVPS